MLSRLITTESALKYMDTIPGLSLEQRAAAVAALRTRLQEGMSKWLIVEAVLPTY